MTSNVHFSSVGNFAQSAPKFRKVAVARHGFGIKRCSTLEIH